MAPLPWEVAKKFHVMSLKFADQWSKKAAMYRFLNWDAGPSDQKCTWSVVLDLSDTRLLRMDPRKQQTAALLWSKESETIALMVGPVFR